MVRRLSHKEDLGTWAGGQDREEMGLKIHTIFVHKTINRNPNSVSLKGRGNNVFTAHATGHILK